MDEPEVIINGQRLSVAETMTLHVAVQSYVSSLTRCKYPLGRDNHGKTMTKSYLRHLGTITDKMMANQK